MEMEFWDTKVPTPPKRAPRAQMAALPASPASLVTICAMRVVEVDVPAELLEDVALLPRELAERVEAMRGYMYGEHVARASQQGDLDAVLFFCGKKAGARRHQRMHRAVTESAGSGYLHVVQGLLLEGDRQDLLPAALAAGARGGRLALVQWLVSKGEAAVNAGEGAALQGCLLGGHFGVARWLVDEGGADVHAHNDAFWHNAAQRGLLRVMKWLMADHDDGRSIRGHANCALRGNSACGRLPIVRWLVTQGGADVHTNNDAPLRQAAAYGHVDVVRWLVEEGGVDVHASDDAALSQAAFGGHADVVRWLVTQGGANVHAGNDQALINSVRGKHWDVARWLIDEGGANAWVYSAQQIFFWPEDVRAVVVRPPSPEPKPKRQKRDV